MCNFLIIEFIKDTKNIMGCCQTTSDSHQRTVEDDCMNNNINLKKPNADEKSIKILENFAYYEKNPKEHGKYIIKKRQIQKTIPILRSVSESSLLVKRHISLTTKESTDSNEVVTEERISPITTDGENGVLAS